MILFLIFVIIPLIEIGLFVEVGGAIGLFKTLFLCVLTAMAGAVIIRWQGLHTLASAQRALHHGELPVEELFDGICIAVAGALLLTPGFFTDSIGFCLLTPPFRAWLREKLSAHFDVAPMEPRGPFDGPYGGRPRDPTVIDAEYERLDDQDKP